MFYLIGFSLSVHVLKIEQFWDIGVDINMMTTVDAGKPEAKSFRTCHSLCKADIFGTGQQFLE